MMIFAIFALSLELLVGATGLVCFGQAAFFGFAGYAAAQLSPRDARPRRCGGCCRWRWRAARPVALFIGALSLRTKGVYFIMVTLAFAQMALLRVARHAARAAAPTASTST